MKSFTWADTFKIIDKAFHFDDQGDVAGYFNVDSSTIGRLKSGETKRFKKLSLDEIFYRLFDVENKKSPMYESEKTEKGALEHLKKVIVDLNMKPMLEDIWENKEKNTFGDSYKNGDYKKFVMTLLHRTSNEHLPKSESKGKASSGSNKPNDIIKNQNESNVSLSQDLNSYNIQAEKPSIQAQGTITGLADALKYKMCMSCKLWDGRKDDALQIPNGVYGRCKLYNECRISIDCANCNGYDPDYADISKLMLADKLPST